MNGIGFPLPEASVNAREVDTAFFSVLGIAGAIFVLLLGLIVCFLIRYRKGSSARRGPLPKTLRREIEIGWTTATTFLAIFIFWWFVGGMTLPSHGDPDQLEIHVVAKQWMWKAEHPDGAREIDALHIPLGRPIHLVMTSEDVIHSFYVPAFRLKQDVLPGRDTDLAFTPTRIGDFHLLCAEYCGTQHSHMTGEIVVMTPSDYQAWLKAQPEGDPAVGRGEALYGKLGCGACHSADSRVGAPALGGLMGRSIELEDGRRIVADEAFIRHVLLRPRDDIVAGYPAIMPSYAEVAKPDDIDALVAYIKSLPERGTAP